ncbi:hypothetical protein BUE60_25655 [Pseudomonas syringae pv. actinidiae]|nr:hypothetical protein B1R35_29880 [Pseudomonas syringae pv. actinidiae]AQX67723.1 hypothetical protein B1F85_29915 [Pseudomonas syringae pv. actinidiae]PBK48872.1 hypothetical protein BUE60_25655 [Pseudomonas syringae pv. actinidiae]PBK53338.1 hypothetical protein BUE61_12395 [Pseudomonas syringae pv. actinidiae]
MAKTSGYQRRWTGWAKRVLEMRGFRSVRTGLLLILAESRRSGLVREKAGTFSENALSELTASRTSPLPRPSGKSL